MNRAVDRVPRFPAASRLFGLAPLLLFTLLAFLLAISRAAPADEVDRDLEPSPPWVFFDKPDPRTAEEIAALVKGFDDLNQVIPAREALVKRFGVLSVPRLVRVLGAEGTQARNEPHTWNAALTASALRNTWGNARELWPLLEPLARLADQSAEPYRRAFSALALGAFRSPAFAPPRPLRSDPLLVRHPEIEVRKHLEQGLEVLGRHVDDFHSAVRVAAALALGKSGAPKARTLLRAEERLRAGVDAAVAPHQAVLLAVGLLQGQDDEPLLLAALKDGKREIRRAVALAVALQVLHDHPPGWTNAPERMLRALRADTKIQLEDGAEAVFARGVLAAHGLAPEEWRSLVDLARKPSTKEMAARSAAQCLLFCEEPWFPDLVLQSVTEGIDLKSTVLAAFLLLLGEDAREEGIEVCRKYLSNKGKRPRGKAEWDVRYFAAVGLLRALASGRLTDERLRTLAMAALDGGLERGLIPGPFRETLDRVLDLERRPLRENPDYALPEERLFEVERSFRDPHGLFARDIRDVAVVRLNDMVPVVFKVSNLKPGQPGDRDKSQVPRRFLKAWQDHFPYFTRLDLEADRGLRPPPEMPRGDDPQREVRRP